MLPMLRMTLAIGWASASLGNLQHHGNSNPMPEAFNILGEPREPVDAADAELLCMQAIHHAAAGDPRWAAWYLEHSPTTASTWSDAAVSGRIEREVAAKFYRAVIAYGMPLHEQQRFLLFMQQEGLPIADAEDDVKLRETIEERIRANIADGHDDSDLRVKIQAQTIARIVELLKRPGLPRDALSAVLERLRMGRYITAEEAQV